MMSDRLPLLTVSYLVCKECGLPEKGTDIDKFIQ
jgi:hypothetical protein